MVKYKSTSTTYLCIIVDTNFKPDINKLSTNKSKQDYWKFLIGGKILQQYLTCIFFGICVWIQQVIISFMVSWHFYTTIPFYF
jgi:hypothetical protein